MRKSIQVTVGIQVDNLRQFKTALEILASYEVLVGVPDKKADRRDVKTEPVNNAVLAYIHDKGSPAANIPQRPFMEPGIEEAREPIQKHMRNAGELVLTGKSPMSELNAAGLTAQNSIRAKINSGIPPALAKSTLAARRRRSRTGTIPLIDTGQLRNAISYVVTKRGA